MKGLALAAVVTLAAAGVVVARRAPDRFDHPKHASLFPSCTSCHAGTVASGMAILPAPATCTACHDGKTERTVEWDGALASHPVDLRFVHAKHPEVSDCLSCHGGSDEKWMEVKRAEPAGCLSCHGVRAEHLAQPDSMCAFCHSPLAGASERVTAVAVGKYPAPPSHGGADFGAGGAHAAQARASGASCATCHAQNFCAQCHIDGAKVASIGALGTDERALAIMVSRSGPASHARSDFERAHGREARRSIQSCATCHTQPNCTSCHVEVPRVAATLVAHDPRPSAASGRHPPPASHEAADWESVHGGLAGARPQNCSTCHTRGECLDCHRPDPAQGLGGFHPAGFLAGHPSQAYGRQTSCADCHNTQSFCQDCHQQSGVVASSRLTGGFHDSKQSFTLGHGQAARQSLESCVSCHAERDCLSCHSASRGRGFNPHGPGFDPERLKKKNPGMCAACHAAGSI
jgi:hypothetical protein